MMKKITYTDKNDWFSNNYFSEGGFAYVVIGGNTYDIKETLKENGYHYNSLLGWFASSADAFVPDGYSLLEVSFDSLYDWCEAQHTALTKEGAKETVEALILSTVPESPSDFIGEVGERLRNLKVRVEKMFNFNSVYGAKTACTFTYGDNELVWFTTAYCNFEVGELVDLTGTVKEHKIYKNVKQTVLTRCKVV